MTSLIELAERVEAATGPDRRLLARLDRSGDCWLWTGPLDDHGRGRVMRNGKLMLHHRAVWEILVGPIPAGALLCHHCDNPTCGNPAHLYVGDGKSNVADQLARGRHWAQRDPDRAKQIGARLGASNTWSRGQGNPKAKLTAEQAAEIATSDASTRALAAQYGLHPTSIQRIRRGVQWTS